MVASRPRFSVAGEDHSREPCAVLARRYTLVQYCTVLYAFVRVGTQVR